jgi:single-strand DNA-binding protein
MTVNKVILVGNLGADPESRTTPNGAVVTNLRVATSERQKDKDGNWGEHTEWHRVKVWGRSAENAAKYLKKGAKVYIEGKLETQKWTDRDGKERYSTDVVTFDVRFLDGRRDGPRSDGGSYPEGGSGGYGGSGGGRDSGPSDPDGRSRGGPSEGGGGGGPADEDIPF